MWIFAAFKVYPRECIIYKVKRYALEGVDLRLDAKIRATQSPMEKEIPFVPNDTSFEGHLQLRLS